MNTLLTRKELDQSEKCWVLREAVKTGLCIATLATLSACGSGSGSPDDNPALGEANGVNTNEPYTVVLEPGAAGPVAVVELDPSNFIQVRMRAIDAFGAGPWSEPIPFRHPALNDESESTPLPGVDSLSQSAEWIQWEPTDGALGYELSAINSVTGTILGEFTLPTTEVCSAEFCRIEPKRAPEETTDNSWSVTIDDTANEGPSPYYVDLNALISTDADLTLSYTWSISGIFVDDDHKQDFQHTLNTPGEYRVKVVAVDETGTMKSGLASITVLESTDVSDNFDAGIPDQNEFEGAFPTAGTGDFKLVKNALPPALFSANASGGVTAPGTDAPTDNTGSPEPTEEQPAVTPEPTVDGQIPTVETNPLAVIPSGTPVTEPASEKPVEAPVVTTIAPTIANTDDTTAPTITAIKSSDIGADTAVIAWTASENSTGQVEYGTDNNLGLFSRLESSFKWSAHIQRLQNLQPSTTYSYRVRSTDATGNESVSGIATFDTSAQLAAAEPTPSATLPPPEDWPSGTNGNLPMAGIFYGNNIHGVGIQNAGIGVESSRRFRAERTGNIDFVRYNNRTLSGYNISSRCDSIGGVWCACANAGLDDYTCGYTLGSSYHVGNGGTLVVELRTNDANGLPSSTVLGKTGRFVPMDNGRSYYPKLTFETPVPVQEGQIYHLVFTNLTPPTSCALTGVSPSRAASCPRNQGAIGLNGVRILGAPSTTGARGPYNGDTAGANFYRRNTDSSWRLYKSTLSYYEVGYTDGVAVGDSYLAIDAMRAARQVVTSSTHARQLFTVQDASRNVDGLWLNHGQTRNADGGSLSVVLRDEAGRSLATGTIGTSAYCKREANDSSKSLGHWCQDWGYTTFGTTVTLVQGETYSVDFSSAQNSGFILSAYSTLRTYGFSDRNHWEQSRAQFSTNGGSSWNSWIGNTNEYDLGLLFTIEGMPRQMR